MYLMSYAINANRTRIHISLFETPDMWYVAGYVYKGVVLLLQADREERLMRSETYDLPLALNSDTELVGVRDEALCI